MSFNAKKCKVIHFRKKNISYEYHLDGCAIESVSEEKDLGVWMEEDMRPTKQRKMAAQTANWALGQLTKTFHYRKATYLVPLYKSFVRPKVEHAVGAWSPWLEGDKEALERIQKRLIRSISDKRGGTYEERLRSVGLTTLEERKRRHDRDIQNDKWFQQSRQSRVVRLPRFNEHESYEIHRLREWRWTTGSKRRLVHGKRQT